MQWTSSIEEDRAVEESPTNSTLRKWLESDSERLRNDQIPELQLGLFAANGLGWLAAEAWILLLWLLSGSGFEGRVFADWVASACGLILNQNWIRVHLQLCVRTWFIWTPSQTPTKPTGTQFENKAFKPYESSAGKIERSWRSKVERRERLAEWREIVESA